MGGRTPSGYEERRFYPEDVRRAQKGREREHGRKGLDGVRWEDDRSSSGYGGGGSSSSRKSSGSRSGSERGSGYGGRHREV